MTINQILGEACVRLSLDDITQYPLTTEVQTNLAKMLRCANIVYQEIFTNYLPQTVEETVELDADKELEYSELSEQIIRPLRLTKDGYPRPIKCGSYKLKSDFSGTGKLEYSYVPDALTLNDTIPDARILPWIFADGVAGEYAFYLGLYDLAQAYDTKFRDAMLRLKYKGRNIYWRARQWNR